MKVFIIVFKKHKQLYKPDLQCECRPNLHDSYIQLRTTYKSYEPYPKLSSIPLLPLLWATISGRNHHQTYNEQDIVIPPMWRRRTSTTRLLNHHRSSMLSRANENPISSMMFMQRFPPYQCENRWWEEDTLQHNQRAITPPW